MSKLETNTIDNISGSSTLTIGSTNTTTVSIPEDVTLGASGKTITIPSGATIANSGTATGFGVNTPAFQMSATSNQSISTGTQTTVAFDSTLFDTDSGVDLSNNKYVIPTGKGGKYYFYASIRRNSWTSSRCYISFRVNNSDVYYAENGNDNFQTVYGAITLNLSASDEILVQYYHDNGGTQNLNGSSATEHKVFFGGYKLIGV